MSESPQPTTPTREQVIAGLQAMMDAIVADELDLAGHELESLAARTGRSMDHPDVLYFRVLIAIQRGQSLEALQYLTNEFGEDAHPELRVLCLYSIQDPLWEGLAQALSETGDASTRQAMTLMLERYREVMAGVPH